MRMCFHSGMRLLIGVGIAASVTVSALSPGWAQEKHKISYKASGADSKYTQQYVIDVGDVPGHQVRLLELHRVYSSNPPVYDGVSVIEEWSRGYSDYTDGSGHGWGYTVSAMENGSKIFARYDGTAQAVVGSDESKKVTFTGMTTLTGGTGRFRGIRGTMRVNVIFDPKAGYNEGQFDGEYWTE